MAALSAPALAAPAVSDAWSRPAVAGGVGGGFMTLSNPDRTADTLVRVETASAARVEIHRSSMTNGVAAMQMLSKLDLPPGAKVTFGPGGHHLMFIGLKASTKIGDTIPATLVFASGARVKATFTVTLTPPSDTTRGTGAHTHH